MSATGHLARLALVLLAACTPAPEVPTRAMIAETTLPPMKTFGRVQPQPVARANADLVRDFLDLTFQLESGRALPVFTRFEGPISVRVTGAPPPSLQQDLGKLLTRLRSEAGIDIRQTSPNSQAGITIEAVSRAQIKRALPQAACFVVPNVASLREYRAARNSSLMDWARLTTRTKLAIFVPSDASPQELRDCLHEELAQAIGPLNDLYRLVDSVFNDDNVHTVLTASDMLIMRAIYAPELRSGMTRNEAAARLPAIFDRLNPAGRNRPPRALVATPRAYAEAIQTALGPGSGLAARRRAADRALQIAVQSGMQDHRRAFAHYAVGRLQSGSDPDGALKHFETADRIYAAEPHTDLHRAYVATQLAAYAITAGDGPRALRLIEPYVQVAAEGENAALLATLLMMRAEALELTGDFTSARAVRLDSLGWARYGFGSEWAVRAREREIHALSPLKG